MSKLQVLGICAGNGATLLPFLGDSRFKLLGNIEPRSTFYTPGNEQWVSNYGDILLQKTPIENISPDIIIGHPDCGHSSALTYSRAKALKDPKDNASLNLFFSCIPFYSPKVWVMENLPKLLDTYGRAWFRETFPEYAFKFIIGSVSYFGNSQVSRKRLVIVAKKRNLEGFKLKASNLKLKVVKELIGDLGTASNASFGHIHEPIEKVVCLWWEGEKVSLAKTRDIWRKQLIDSYSWPGHYNAKTQPGVYKLFPHKYPRTVRKQNRQFNHLGLPLTPREMARIQGIPDNFKIHIEVDRLEYWVNKGRVTVAKCPPYEIFTWFKQLILNNYETLHAGDSKKGSGT